MSTTRLNACSECAMHHPSSQLLKYAVILDAGSSGTRLYIYQWDKWPGEDCKRGACKEGPDCKESQYENTEVPADSLCDEPCQKNHCHRYAPPPKIKEIYNWKKEGGLAKVAANKVGEYLDDLLDRARLFLGRGVDRTKTPLYVLGTAGIRDLDGKRQNKLLEAMKKHTIKAGFMIEECRFISGKDEALYGWLAANYLNEKFSAQGISHGATYGYLEMGGASAQIAFRPTKQELGLENVVNAADAGENAENPTQKYTSKLERVILGNRKYYLYTKSDPLGADKAWRHHQAALETRIESTLEDPCLPIGYSYSTDYKVITGSDPEQMSGKVAEKIAQEVQEKTPGVPAAEKTPETTQQIDSTTEAPSITFSDILFGAALIAAPFTIAQIIKMVTPLVANTATDSVSQAELDKISEDAVMGAIGKTEGKIPLTEELTKELGASVAREVKYDNCERTTLQMLHYLNSRGHTPLPVEYPNSSAPGLQNVDILRDGPDTTQGAGREFLGGAQFWYTIREIFGIGADDDDETDPDKYNFTKFRDTVKEKANQPWDILKTVMHTVDERFLVKSFFMAGWITNVLKGYKVLDSKVPVKFQPFNGSTEPGACELTWTLGKVILQSVGCKPEPMDVASIDPEEFPDKLS